MEAAVETVVAMEMEEAAVAVEEVEMVVMTITVPLMKTQNTSKSLSLSVISFQTTYQKMLLTLSNLIHSPKSATLRCSETS